MKRYNLMTAVILLLTIALLAGCGPSAQKAPAGAQPAPAPVDPIQPVQGSGGTDSATQPAAQPPASGGANNPTPSNPGKSLPASSGIDAKLTAGGGALGVAKFSPAQGQKLRLTLELKNNVAAMTIVYSSGQFYDFWVEENGKEVWRWSDGRMFTQAMVNQTFNAGGVLKFEEEWDGTDKSGKKVAPGTYTLHAAWRAQTELAFTPQPAPIQIVVE